jgi:tRNA U55 pseudouridine synthase TruB
MRSVAHEIGERLGCGAHLESLRRTAVAEFDITQAHTLEEIEASSTANVSAATPNCHSERANANASRRIAMAATESGSAVVNSPGPEAPQALKPSSLLALDGTSEHRALPDRIYAIGSNGSPRASFFIHPRQLLPQIPSVTADETTAARIRSGRPVNLPELSRSRQVKVFLGQTELIAIASRVAGTLFHPKIVFPADV